MSSTTSKQKKGTQNGAAQAAASSKTSVPSEAHPVSGSTSSHRDEENGAHTRDPSPEPEHSDSDNKDSEVQSSSSEAEAENEADSEDTAIA